MLGTKPVGERLSERKAKRFVTLSVPEVQQSLKPLKKSGQVFLKPSRVTNHDIVPSSFHKKTSNFYSSTAREPQNKLFEQTDDSMYSYTDEDLVNT